MVVGWRTSTRECAYTVALALGRRTRCGPNTARATGHGAHPARMPSAPLTCAGPYHLGTADGRREGTR
jgi:hypothetical protein